MKNNKPVFTTTDQTVIPLFSKVFYFKVLKDLDLKRILKIAQKQKLGDAGIHGPQDVDNMSLASLNKSVLRRKEFKFLKTRLLEEFNFFKNEVLRFNDTKFVITTSWLAKSLPGQSSNYHNHQNCYYSGILYFQVDDTTGKISFESWNNHRYHLVPSNFNIYNSSEYTFTPRDGLLILFPSEVAHKILKNESSSERWSLAFNVNPTGKIGPKEGDSFINLNILS